MASKRAIVPILKKTIQVPTRQYHTSLRLPYRPLTPSFLHLVPSPFLSHHRQSSSNSHQPKSYTYEDILALTSDPNPKRILIDVREPWEIVGGRIPTALSLPLGNSPNIMSLSPADFQARFGCPKPSIDTELIFYCRTGVRSRSTAKLAMMAGYHKSGDYGGSWEDWAEREGKEMGQMWTRNGRDPSRDGQGGRYGPIGR